MIIYALDFELLCVLYVTGTFTFFLRRTLLTFST